MEYSPISMGYRNLAMKAVMKLMIAIIVVFCAVISASAQTKTGRAFASAKLTEYWCTTVHDSIPELPMDTIAHRVVKAFNYAFFNSRPCICVVKGRKVPVYGSMIPGTNHFIGAINAFDELVEYDMADQATIRLISLNPIKDKDEIRKNSQSIMFSGRVE